LYCLLGDDAVLNNFLKEIRERVLVYDGSKGTMLQKLGLKGGECPEEWNITHRSEVRQIYKMYKDAGADVIQTNTFQGNRIKLEEYSLGEKTYEINYEGTRLAREVMGRDGFVAASIGPIGKLFEPSGDLTFEVAYNTFKEQIKAVVEGGADVINFETFTDLAEMRAALIAAKEETNLPVICSFSFLDSGRTLMGTDPVTAAIVLNSLGADMIGANCSLGPEHMLDIVKKMSEAVGIYLCVKPNAGLPEMEDGNVTYKETPDKFYLLAKEFAAYGARLIGGCCGTTPDFVKAIKESVRDIKVTKLTRSSKQVITSNVKTLQIDGAKKLNVGRIDSRNDEELYNALLSGQIEYCIDKALDLASEGYDAIYINIDNVKGSNDLLSQVVNISQGYVKEPFILETSDFEALDKALRLYRGKAGVIVDGNSETVLEKLLLSCSKYGSTIICRELLS